MRLLEWALLALCIHLAQSRFQTTAAETTAAETTTAEVTVVPYGDEPITPKPNYVDEPYAPKYGKSSGYGGGEQGSGSISQGGYSGNIKVEPSGYRHRRRRANEYGDESLTPPTPPPGDEDYAPAGEETPAPADQGYGPDLGPPVEPGGYRRKKRQSEYGDENVTPTTISSGDEYAPATEETSAPIDQGYAASEAPPVGPGGYRKKRQSEYGDENIKALSKLNQLLICWPASKLP
ncbi:unnamed protein product [Cylicocyclus nassatus]|uniref:Uncharacterized protein n=1 Tax=Cylicocyclus nassatus TaxID=53992 RepID=A0AA36M6R1_CYLNA|nr:unnamed protein product [Cylicocyclus nassatus]